jgi:hypothetical protein
VAYGKALGVANKNVAIKTVGSLDTRRLLVYNKLVGNEFVGRSL